MMSNDAILSAIQKYASGYLKRDVRCRLPKGYFEQCSYQKWAVDEILRYIEKSKGMPPIMVVEDFIRKMDDFACENRKNGFIFSIAYDVATDILDMLLSMKGES